MLAKAPTEEPFPRLVIVGSETHYFVSRLKQAKKPNILEALNDKKQTTMSQRYYESKRAFCPLYSSLLSDVY